MARPGTIPRGDAGAAVSGLAPDADTRIRILRAATRLFQRSGYAATGMIEIAAAAQAPKGSIYHHFPGGKAQLAVEAIGLLASEVDRLIDRRIAQGVPPGAILEHVAEAMGQWLAGSDWREGCLVSVIALETGPEEAAIHAAVIKAFGGWASRLKSALVAAGFDTSAAGDLADLAIAALEGGLILARVRRSVDPLRASARLAAGLMVRPTAE